ncbi:MAG: hypothetical protein HMLKMBBP_01465 [Planctomycetes bacterium]|nr:hypothetical protein [Planctomycetota bacterium]
MNCGVSAIGGGGTLDKDTDCGSGMGAQIVSKDDACGSHNVAGQPSGYPEPDERCAQSAPDSGRYSDESCGKPLVGSSPSAFQGDNDCAYTVTHGDGLAGDQDCGLGSLSTGTHSDAACTLPSSGDDDCGDPYTGGTYTDGSEPG